MFKPIYLIIGLLLTACSSEKKEFSLQEPKGTSSEAIIRFAEYFDIIENETDTLLHLVHPDDSSVFEKFLLTSDPSKKKMGYTNLNNSGNKLIALSSTVIGMLGELNEENSIVGVLNKNYIYNTEVLRRIESNKIIEVNSTGAIPVERVIAVQPDIIVYSSGFGSELSHRDVLRELGIHSIPLYDWREKHPLGKAEWIVLFGYLTGRPDDAKDYMDHVENQYKDLIASVGKSDYPPVVMSGNVYGDIWNAPTGESYVARLMKDAGASYIYAETKGTGSLKLELERVVVDSKEADYWINPGVPSKTVLLNVNPKAKFITPFIQDKVYCYSHEMNQFWELSAIRPHHMLSDLIHIFRTGTASEDSLYFYRKLHNE